MKITTKEMLEISKEVKHSYNEGYVNGYAEVSKGSLAEIVRLREEIHHLNEIHLCDVIEVKAKQAKIVELNIMIESLRTSRSDLTKQRNEAQKEVEALKGSEARIVEVTE
jgi:hypothetical protein